MSYAIQVANVKFHTLNTMYNSSKGLGTNIVTIIAIYKKKSIDFKIKTIMLTMCEIRNLIVSI